MTIDVIMPCLGHSDKLEMSLNSLFHSTVNIPITLYLYIKDEELYKKCCFYFSSFDEIKLIQTKEINIVNLVNNHLKHTNASIVCYFSDSCQVDKHLFTVIQNEFNKKFPDLDGMIGFRQTNLPEIIQYTTTCGAIGKTYMKRFPDKQVFCPDYTNFYADFELWKYASKINRFYFCDAAFIDHIYFSQTTPTEQLFHSSFQKDKLTFQTRSQSKLLWGQSFQLLRSNDE